MLSTDRHKMRKVNIDFSVGVDFFFILTSYSISICYCDPLNPCRDLLVPLHLSLFLVSDGVNCFFFVFCLYSIPHLRSK